MAKSVKSAKKPAAARKTGKPVAKARRPAAKAKPKKKVARRARPKQDVAGHLLPKYQLPAIGTVPRETPPPTITEADLPRLISILGQDDKQELRASLLKRIDADTLLADDFNQRLEANRNTYVFAGGRTLDLTVTKKGNPEPSKFLTLFKVEWSGERIQMSGVPWGIVITMIVKTLLGAKMFWLLALIAL